MMAKQKIFSLEVKAVVRGTAEDVVYPKVTISTQVVISSTIIAEIVHEIHLILKQVDDYREKSPLMYRINVILIINN
jgi:hypothetical protein